MEDFLDTAHALSWIAVGPSRNAHYARPPVEEWVPGWTMFLYGPLGVLDGQVGWFANPLGPVDTYRIHRMMAARLTTA
jgi:hypothetical protein